MDISKITIAVEGKHIENLIHIILYIFHHAFTALELPILNKNSSLLSLITTQRTSKQPNTITLTITPICAMSSQYIVKRHVIKSLLMTLLRTERPAQSL